MKKARNIFLVCICLYCIPVIAQVETAWFKQYNGPADGHDAATAIAVDDSGNVYVTGYSYPNPDFATIKYGPNGDTIWVRRFNEGGDNNVATGVAVDKNGNVYVTGTRDRSGIGYAFATLKYAPNGDLLWFEYAPESSESPFDMALDSQGNVYVTGRGGSGSVDYFTIKYDPEGDTLWARIYNWPGKYDDEPAIIAVDNFGNCYVTGYGTGEGTYHDFATIKYDSNGNEVWARLYNGFGASDDHAQALSVDDSGNVYVTGYSYGEGSASDYATIKYAADGTPIWVRRYNGPGNGPDFAEDVAVDKDGNVYVTGVSPQINDDFATLKYSPSGELLWERRYNGTGNSGDWAYALEVDTSGYVYVVGPSHDSMGNAPYTFIKYAPNGDILWLKSTDAPRQSGNLFWFDYPFKVDKKGNLYATGKIGSLPNLDYATIKLEQFECLFKPGDVTGDGKMNLQDVMVKVNYVFKGGSLPAPFCRGDDNADEKVNLNDIIYSVNYLFKGGPASLKSRECCL